MKLNDQGIDLIKEFEGCQLDAYLDMVGKPTIGYGTTGTDIHLGLHWTQEDCDKILLADLDHVQMQIKKVLDVDLTDNEFSALCSLVYNIGIGNFKSSTMLHCLNEREWDLAAAEFSKWDHAGGREVPGLLKRRLAEKELFETL